MSNRTMIIVSKTAANQILRNRFPNDHIALIKMKYDSAKYKWKGSAKEYIGAEVSDVSSRIHAIWVERRQDKEGAYAQFMCYTER